MGNTLINDLYDTGQLALDARFQMGTLIDRVSGNAATASGSSVAWGKGPKAQNGIVCTGTGILSFPDTVANRLATGSAEIIIIGNLWNLPDNSRLVSKRAASTSYDIYRISAASGYGLYDGVNSAQFTYLSAARMLVFSITNGSPAKLYADGAFAINGSANTTINSTNVALNIGNYSSGGTPLGAPITRVIEVVRNLTPAEHARLWDEYVAEGASPDLPRRNFVYYEQAREDSWYTAQGIVLDTDFVRRSDGKIRDNSPSNYAGTIAGIPSPGPNEQGLVCGLNDSINFGNVTQLFRVGTFTLDGWFLWSSTLVGAVYTHINWLDSTDNFAIYVSSSATTSTITVFLSNGTTASGTTSATVLRAGQKQHLAVVFNGTGVGNAGRLQVYVDGQPVTLSFSGTIPATTSNTLQPFYAGYVAGLNEPGTKLDMRLRTSALSAAQVRAVYLATGAQRLTLRETFEDVPVSLATVPVGGYLGPWRLASGAAPTCAARQRTASDGSPRTTPLNGSTKPRSPMRSAHGASSCARIRSTPWCSASSRTTRYRSARLDPTAMGFACLRLGASN